MPAPARTRLQRWRIVVIIGQLVVAVGFGSQVFSTPLMALMVIPPLAVVAYALHGMLRRTDGLSTDQLVTEFGFARGLGVGTLGWVGLSLLSVVLAEVTGQVGWELLGVLGFFVFAAISSAHRRAARRLGATRNGA